MADEAFALSPISARAAKPSEADYDAIQEAFMETSRGRWFLGEYAKRNRNADTRMVLDAVARIEDALAASKKMARDPLLDEALASLRSALLDAREAAAAALGDLALEQNLAPVRKGVRVIREISWRLREIGADGRICDLIDSQIAAIEGATGKLAPADLAGALSGAFDRIEGKIKAFAANGEAPTSQAVADAAPPAKAEAPLEVPTEAATEPVSIADAVHAVEVVAPAESEVADEAVDAFNAEDEATLNLVAMEMEAPDTDTAYEEPDIAKAIAEESFGDIEVSFGPREPAEVSEPKPAAEEPPLKAAIATVPPVVTPIEIVPEPQSEPEIEAVIEAVPEMRVESEPSLGSSLLANGIISRPRAAKPDPLAPIRRMTQTEKIAFFS